ncbi:hypothetical protein Tco_0810453 [Tanacetum coccineum]
MGIQSFMRLSAFLHEAPFTMLSLLQIKPKEIKHMKAHIKKLKEERPNLVIHTPQELDESVSMKAMMAGKKSLKKQMWEARYEVHEEKEVTEKEVLRDQSELRRRSSKKKGKKGVELKDVEETERPRPTSTRSLLTLKPLPKIDPKDKGKKKIEEEEELIAESEGYNLKLKRNLSILLGDEEARLNADKILAENFQEEEREIYTIKQRAKLLIIPLLPKKIFFAQQRSNLSEINPPFKKTAYEPMMTYLNMFDDSFIVIGSAEDEKVIKEMNEQVYDASKKRVKRDDSIKGEIKEEEGTRKETFSDEDKEVDYEILDKKYPIIEWRSEYLTTKPQYDKTEEIEDVYLNVVIRSNRQRRYFSTLMAMLSILDRDDTSKIEDSETGSYISQLLKLKLETEEDRTIALELIRFIKKQIAELEPEDSDRDEKDL